MYLFRLFHRWDRWSSADSTFDFASSTCDDAYGILFAQPLRPFVLVFFPPAGLLQLPWPKLLLDPQGFLPFCTLFFILSWRSLSGIPFAQLFCHLHLSCFSSPLCHITKSTLFVWLLCQVDFTCLATPHCQIAQLPEHYSNNQTLTMNFSYTHNSEPKYHTLSKSSPPKMHVT